MRCIVTGGAGFIGSHISDRLIQAGHEVLVVDNFSSGKQENINAKADVLDADINDAKSLSTLIKYQPEIIFHLAAQISVRKSVADPIFDAQTNILGTVRLAQMAIDCGTKKFIFASKNEGFGSLLLFYRKIIFLNFKYCIYFYSCAQG